MGAKPELIALDRHWVWADRMRAHFDGVLERVGTPDLDTPDGFDAVMYMSLWYGCCQAVLEGWGRLQLQDPEVATLLVSSNVSLLKGFRNRVFHCEGRYWDDKFLAFLRDGLESGAWVRDLHYGLGRGIRAELQKQQGVAGE